MNRTSMADALARLQQLLFSMPVLESFIARREAGEVESDDADTAAALATELIAHQSPNGSWGDSLALTTEALLTLSQLRPFPPTVTDSIARALAWLRSRQRAPGSFVDTCTPERHALSLCHHFAAGFFSPGPSSVSFARAQLGSGVVLSTDEDARLGLSAFALRAVLEYQRPSTDDRLQFEALRRIAEMLFTDRSRVSTPAAVAVLTALTRAPRTAQHTAILHGALSRLAGTQRADGSWPEAEGFHIAEALMIADRAGYGSPLFDKAIERTAELLIRSQQDDGSWGVGAGPQRLLIGWRALRYAMGIRSSVSHSL